ncbi:glycosyltransferase [Patescibacteria group bacterium]|nr:glycosyltransferase [Patescibacteria group bacterium]
MSYKILIFFADAGGGHRSAAEAIKSALDNKYPSSCSTVLVECLSECASWPFSLAGKLYSVVTTHTPWLWGVVFHLSNTKPVAWLTHILTNLIFNRGVREMLIREKPDLVLSTYHLVGSALRKNIESKDILEVCPKKPTYITVITDLFDIHRAWFLGEPDLYIMPTFKAKKRAVEFGISVDKIHVIGLPVHEHFYPQSKKQKSELRRKLGLKVDVATVMVVGGGEGAGPIFEIVQEISHINYPLQLVVVCGRNEKLRKKLTIQEWKSNVKICGFVDNMPDWMGASDFVVTKAGPGTIMEVISCRLPIIVYDYYPGQEKGNVKFVEESGVGEFIKHPKLIAEKILYWSTGGCKEVEKIKDNQRKVGNLRVSEDITMLIKKKFIIRL